jgi:hypothetical protein
MAASLEALSSGKLHVGTVASQQIMGSPVSLSSIIPGTFTASGPAYIGQCVGGDIANAALSVGPRLVPTGLLGVGVPTPGIASLIVFGAPMAIQANGGVNVIGLFNVSGIATKAGADVKASVSTTGGCTVEASSTANGRNNATAGAITCSKIKAGFGAFASVAAPFKQFDIPHPTKGKGWRLAHAALEGPEMGVYYRGKTKEKIIKLPEYWTELVHEESITVQLTPIGKACSSLHVKKIEDNAVTVGHQAQDLEYFYIIHGERKDLGDLIIEYRGDKPEDFKISKEKIKRNGEVVIDNGHKGLAPLPLNPLGN